MDIKEDHVSFEVAKLLKEKGFDIPVRYEYHFVHNINQKPQFHRHLRNFNGDEYSGLHSKWYSAPTISMACKWLREVYNIFIEIYLPSHSEHEDTIYHGTYSFDIFNLNTKVYVYCTWNEKEFNSYEEACEAALKYALENLI